LVVESPGNEAVHIATALQEGDAAARGIIAELAADLALGLSHVVHLFHPQVIILGGGLAGVGEPLRGEVERALRGLTMEAFAPDLRIQLTSLSTDVVPMGALLLASQGLSAVTRQ
jgi:glucokinase